MAENIVDLRKERERREEEQRRALRAVVEDAPEEDVEEYDDEKDDEDPEQSPPPEPNELMSWEALEFIEYPKNKRIWVRNTVIISTVIVVLFLFLKNFLGAVLTVFGAFAFLSNAFQSPSRVQYAIREDGIVSGGRVTLYEQIESFWIFLEDEDKVLSLKRKGLLPFPLRVPLGDVDEESVRSILEQHVPEEEQSVSLIDGIIRQIGY